MKLQIFRPKAFTALLALPLLLGITACSKPPEITASSREEAMHRCMADAKAALNQVNEERARAKADPSSADFDTNPNFYSDYLYWPLFDTEWETVEISRVFCVPAANAKFKNYFYNTGYIEYIKRPTGNALGSETKVEKTIVSYGYHWIQE